MTTSARLLVFNAGQLWGVLWLHLSSHHGRHNLNEFWMVQVQKPIKKRREFLSNRMYCCAFQVRSINFILSRALCRGCGGFCEKNTQVDSIIGIRAAECWMGGLYHIAVKSQNCNTTGTTLSLVVRWRYEARLDAMLVYFCVCVWGEVCMGESLDWTRRVCESMLHVVYS